MFNFGFGWTVRAYWGGLFYLIGNVRCVYRSCSGQGEELGKKHLHKDLGKSTVIKRCDYINFGLQCTVSVCACDQWLPGSQFW